MHDQLVDCWMKLAKRGIVDTLSISCHTGHLIMRKLRTVETKEEKKKKTTNLENKSRTFKNRISWGRVYFNQI